MKTQFLIIIVAVLLNLQSFASYAKEIDPSMVDDFLLKGDGNSWNLEDKSDIGTAFKRGYANGFLDASLFIATMANYEIASSEVISQFSKLKIAALKFLILPFAENKETFPGDIKRGFVDGEKLSNDLSNLYIYDNRNKEGLNHYYLEDLGSITLYSVKQCANIINRFALFDISGTQLQEGLDDFYRDFKNKQIRIHDAIYVVRKQVQGTLPEDIERLLVWLRQGKKDDDLLNIRDKDGKIVRVIAFP